MSFGQKAFNPGNVNVRLGAVMADYEQAFSHGDLPKAANCLRLIKGHLAHYMTARQKQEYDALPGYATGDHRTKNQVAEDMETRREYLLQIAVERNVWARGEPEEGDASTLSLTPTNYAEATQ